MSMFNSLPILFAKLNEIISVLVGLAFLVMWVVNQINDAKKKQLAQAERPKGAAPPPLAPAQAAAGAPPPADPLRAQIDEFLRRAGQPPKPLQPAPPQPAQQPMRPPAGRDEIVVLIDDPKATAPPRQPLADKLRSMGDAAAALRGQPAKPPQPPRERKPVLPQRVAQQRPASVAEHVAERIGAVSQEFRKEVADLGERVKQADEQFDRQLQQKFDHTLGSLGDRDAPRADDQRQPAGGATSPAAQMAALLASPDGVRQAILLNEILLRPVDRW